MKLKLIAETRSVKGGIEARSPDLRLAAHGIDEDDALFSLKRGILAWCAGLQSIGRLEEALKRNKISYEDSNSVFDVEFCRNSVPAYT